MPVWARECRDTDYFVKKCVSRGGGYSQTETVPQLVAYRLLKIKTDREEALGVKASEACLSTSL